MYQVESEETYQAVAFVLWNGKLSSLPFWRQSNPKIWQRNWNGKIQTQKNYYHVEWIYAYVTDLSPKYIVFIWTCTFLIVWNHISLQFNSHGCIIFFLSKSNICSATRSKSHRIWENKCHMKIQEEPFQRAMPLRQIFRDDAPAEAIWNLQIPFSAFEAKLVSVFFSTFYLNRIKRYKKRFLFFSCKWTD